jgi:hypothetical protein
MWLGAFGLVLGMAASCAGESAGPAGAVGLSQPIHTRQTAFGIPFRIQRAQEPLQEPVEVRLYVSGDRGATWRLYGRVAPAQGHFAFRAGGDGEYWFMVRTLDRAGRLRPRGPERPDLRVVVDTTPPRLHLEAGQAEAGRVTARWQVADAHLNPAALRLQYRTAESQPWRTVATRPEGSAPATGVRTGEASWLVSPGAGRVEIRAEAVDLAGNPAVSQALAALPSPRPAGPTAAWASTQTPQPGVVDIQIQPTPGTQYGPAPDPAPGVATTGLPPGVRPRILNTRVFELDYAVDAVGPSGIARVEVWGTRDGGRNWTSFGVDEDRESPILVTAEEEGIYGFCVCVENGVGLGGGPPPSGRPPDIWIGVDLTKPAVRLIDAEQGTGPQAGQLLLRWEARDWALTAQPVSLFYSANPVGPWTPIVSGLQRAGEYPWTVASDVPERLYLRVEARDEAGNLGIYETPQPTLLDRLRPSVHIRDVRPLDRHRP